MTCIPPTSRIAALNLDGTDAFKPKPNPPHKIETLRELRETYSKAGKPLPQRPDFRGNSRHGSKPSKSSKVAIVSMFRLDERSPSIQTQKRSSDQMSNTSGCPTQSEASRVRACKSDDGDGSEASWAIADLELNDVLQSSVELNGEKPNDPEEGWVLAGDPNIQMSTHSNASQSSVSATDCK